MPAHHDEIKVIHIDFEKEMYEPTLFEYDLSMHSKSTKSPQDRNVCILVRWRFEAFELGSKKRYGSYVSEQNFYIDYPNDDLDILKCDIDDALSLSLSTSRSAFVASKGKLKDIAIAEFKYPNFPELDHIQSVLSQFLNK